MPGSSGFLLLAAAGCYRGNRRLSDSFTLNSSSALNAKVRTPEQMFLLPSRPKDAGDATDLYPGKVLPTSSLFLPHTSLGHQVPQETDKGLQHPQVPSSCWFPTHSQPWLEELMGSRQTSGPSKSLQCKKGGKRDGQAPLPECLIQCVCGEAHEFCI